MRVISGKYKGRNILPPARGEVRPTSGAVKESIFSILTSMNAIDGANCLDLFCGTGGLGIEALSRGAKYCTFCDIDTFNVSRNIEKIGIDDARVVRGDYKKALRLIKNERFDLVFCDPPYKSGLVEDAMHLIFKYGMVENGIIILEHNSANNLINLPNDCIIDHRVFGLTALDIIKRGNNEGDIRGDV